MAYQFRIASTKLEKNHCLWQLYISMHLEENIFSVTGQTLWSIILLGVCLEDTGFRRYSICTFPVYLLLTIHTLLQVHTVMFWDNYHTYLPPSSLACYKQVNLWQSFIHKKWWRNRIHCYTFVWKCLNNKD